MRTLKMLWTTEKLPEVVPTLRLSVLVCKMGITDLFCLFKGTGATKEETNTGLRS